MKKSFIEKKIQRKTCIDGDQEIRNKDAPLFLSSVVYAHEYVYKSLSYDITDNQAYSWFFPFFFTLLFVLYGY